MQSIKNCIDKRKFKNNSLYNRLPGEMWTVLATESHNRV